mgnify:CR=1 FL=1
MNKTDNTYDISYRRKIRHGAAASGVEYFILSLPPVVARSIMNNSGSREVDIVVGAGGIRVVPVVNGEKVQRHG